MHQLIQEHDWSDHTTQYTNSRPDIRIKSEVPAINLAWIRNTLNEFLDDHKELSGQGTVTAFFTTQPIKNKIIKCTAYVNTNSIHIASVGEGIDEYDAISDLIKNLTIELRITIDQNQIEASLTAHHTYQSPRSDQYTATKNTREKHAVFQA